MKEKKEPKIKIFSFKDLTKTPLPEGVDPAHKEVY
jgi:hypothetical protein